MIDFQQHTITWMGRTIPMKSQKQMSMKTTYMEQYYNHLEAEEEEDFKLLAELYEDDVAIMDRKHQAVSPEEVVVEPPHIGTKASTSSCVQKIQKGVQWNTRQTPHSQN